MSRTTNAQEKVLATNRKAFHEYEILDRAEAGIVLRGSEVKSIREGGLSFRDSYVEFRGGVRLASPRFAAVPAFHQRHRAVSEIVSFRQARG